MTLTIKKSHPHSVRCLYIALLLLFIQQHTHAQVPEPAAWQTFVDAKEGITTQDTFRLQSFEGTAKDNWRYEASEGCVMFDALSVEISGQGGRQSLKLPLGSSIKFTRLLSEGYKDVIVSFNYGRKNMVKGEDMFVNPYRPFETGESQIQADAKYPVSGKFGKIIAAEDQQGAPQGLDIRVSKKASNSKDGFYCLDSVYAFGTIPLYSLFTGSGSWSDTTCWSHLPAARHRRALIEGHVLVDADTQCGELHIGNGSFSVAPDADFATNTVSIHRTFGEKARWYFISFPFDVYPDGIDPSFDHKDDTPNEGGNYFYLLSYDGKQRAMSASSNNNWQVLSPKDIPSGQPLFLKNKGYLISLDAAANRQTLCFSSRPDAISAQFGKSGAIPVHAFASANNEHSGWYLCGNPLPAPLSLSQIERNSAIDGNIYVYNGSTYTAYSLGSDHALPPFSAFFVKATTSTKLTIRTTSSPLPKLIAGASLPLQQLSADPSSVQPAGLSPLSQQMPKSHIHGGNLHLSDLPSEGQISIITFGGQPIRSHTVSAGSSLLPLSLARGLYIIHIRSGNYRICHKHIEM